MRLLFIAPRLPIPAYSGGQIRTLNLLKQAAKAHRTDLVCFSFDAGDAGHAEQLRGLNIGVTLVPAAREPNLLQQIGAVAFAAVPYSVTKYWSPGMEAAITRLTRDTAYDVVHFEQIHMTHYDKLFDRRRCLVDEQNVEYQILERCAAVEKSLIKKYVLTAQARKMKRFEARKIAGFSACSAVSDEDGKVLMTLVGNDRPVFTLPNGVDTEFFRPPGDGDVRPPEEDAVVFTGNMHWVPNEDAALYFGAEILPRIWITRPTTRFYIVGIGDSARIKELARNEPRIIPTGRVDDVRRFTARAKVFVVPLRIGGGTRLKILEAMSMERAIVSTSIGAEGIDYTEDANIVLADRPDVFAAKVVSLLHDDQRRRELGVAGRKLVLEKYDWNIIGHKLHRIYGDLLRLQPGPGPSLAPGVDVTPCGSSSAIASV